jgi:integrase
MNNTLTITVRMVQDRPKPWGVFWTEPPQPPQTRRQKRSRYFLTQSEADTFKADFLAALRAETTTTDTTPRPTTATTTKRGSVAAYLATWLDHIKKSRDAATYASYEIMVRVHIVPARMKGGETFGQLPMAGLRRLIVRTLYEDLFDRGVSLATRRHVHSCLSSACSMAVEDEVLESNPCFKLGKRLRHTGEASEDPKPNPLTADESVRFFRYVESDAPEWLEFFTFLHDTGVRPGEAAALRWDRIDWKGKRAEIVANFSPASDTDKDPKTHQKRWVDLSDLLVDQLTRLRARQREEALARGLTPRKYVFTTRIGTPRRNGSNVRRAFNRILAATKIGYVQDKRGQWIVDPSKDRHTPYDLRATFATTHLCADYRRMPWVSRQLGHNHVRTTEAHYFHLIPSTVTKGYANAIR